MFNWLFKRTMTDFEFRQMEKRREQRRIIFVHLWELTHGARDSVNSKGQPILIPAEPYPSQWGDREYRDWLREVLFA